MPAFTFELPDLEAEVLQAVAEAQRMDVDGLLWEIVHEWVSDQVRLARAINTLNTNGRPARAPREKDYEIALGAALISRGITVLRQVETTRGRADLIAGNCVVVEVKLALEQWGDVHRAQGQADAYAKALSLPHALVCAPGLPDAFRSATVCDVTEAPDVIAAMCHAGTVADTAPEVAGFLASAFPVTGNA